MVTMESSDSTWKLKNFAKRHDKNVEKSVVVLLFIQPMKFFLLLHIEKKDYFKLSLVYILKLCCKDEYMQLFVSYGDVQHNTDKRYYVA